MKVGALTETVQVTADTPMLEVQKPVQAVNISGDMQRSLPLTSKKDWYNFLEVTPSVTNRSVDQAGGQVYMVRGSEIEGHVFQLDGADIGSFRQSRADYIQLSTDAIQDVQVKTGALDASAPIGVGVVVNVATQTGTNVFKGAVGTIYTNRSWNGNNADAGGSVATNNLLQPDVSLGGPILKDHVFFFGAYRYSRQTLGISRNAQQVAYLQGLVPGFKPFDNENSFKYLVHQGHLADVLQPAVGGLLPERHGPSGRQLGLQRLRLRADGVRRQGVRRAPGVRLGLDALDEGGGRVQRQIPQPRPQRLRRPPERRPLGAGVQQHRGRERQPHRFRARRGPQQHDDVDDVAHVQVTRCRET